MELYNKKIYITDNTEKADLITHNGTFHSDEVFSTVALINLIDNTEISLCRTSNIPSNANAFVYDVGLGKYDHHQMGGNGERENGIKYSSFGLIWRDFGKRILEKLNIYCIDEAWEKIDKKLVQTIDAVDNGQLQKIFQLDFEILTIPNLISLYNSNWDKPENQDENFLQAVKFASIIFDKILESINSKLKAKKLVLEAIDKSENQIMILDEFMPWKEFVLESELEKAKSLLYVIFPSIRGGYNVYAVPKEPESFEVRKAFPKEWAGLTNEKLQEVTGVKDATFCHNGRFICSANSKEGALKLAEIAVKSNNQK